VGRPCRTSPLRAWLPAASACRPGQIPSTAAAGNVPVPADLTGLPRDSVVNVSRLLTLDRGFLIEQAGTLPPRVQSTVDRGLRTVLQL
jgi:mRNA-degrading endonuclease toxin of MazEF toxin-antitoxin module